jgi:tRNA-splicing endonuclease subunit Sen54
MSLSCHRHGAYLIIVTTHSSSKHTSLGKWDPEKKKVKMIRIRGHHWSTLGHHHQQGGGGGSSIYIYPEEALFLIDRGMLQLMIGPDDNNNNNNTNKDGGIPVCSPEIAYQLFIQQERVVSIETFQVYMYLKRLGYILIRYTQPSTTTITSTSLLSYKVYKPNSRFRKSSPGSPSFYLFIQR